MLSGPNIIDRIYEAAAVPELWPGVLAELGALVGTDAVAFLAMGRDGRLRGLPTPAYAPAYDNYLAHGTQLRNVRVERSLTMFPHAFGTDVEVCTPEELADDRLYREFLHPFGFGWTAGSVFPIPTGDMLVFDMARAFADGPFDPVRVHKLDLLWPDLARAALLAHRLGLKAARAATEALATVGLPAAVLAAGGRLLSANGLLEGLASRLDIGAFDRVRLTAASADRLLSAAIETLDQPGALPRSIPVPAAGDDPALVVHLIPIRRAAHDIFVGAAAVLAVTAVTTPSAPLTEVLTGLFDLTSAEVKVARGIATGRSIDEVAAAHAVSRETVRSQLKSIMAKTGTARQAELALLLRGTVPIGPAE